MPQPFLQALFKSWRQPLAQSALPARVRTLVADQEDQAERLIGWVQLLVVLSFALLYAIAPRPTDAPTGMLLDPVPLALTEYTLFTVGRLILSYWMRLPPAVLIASILADVGLLLVLIWSFHGQYGQAAPFSLKVPTFVYLFVFIAIRTLRFDHRYVLAAGAAAAIGWAGMVLAVLTASGDDSITRSFVAHLNSSRILLGAEFDKILALLLVTAVLAFAVWRGRLLFLTAVGSQAALDDLSRFFGRGVSDTVVRAETSARAGQAVEREAAILMLDIRGFTQFSAGRSPRQIVDLLTGLHARLIPKIWAHGGVVDKFMGDGIMATFGAVQPSDKAAADSLRALEAVMAEAAAWRQSLTIEGLPSTLSVEGAVVAGSVVFAVVGTGDRLEYTVIGEAVNLAAKLEKHNKVAGTRGLTTGETYRLALLQGYAPPQKLERRAQQDIAGAARPCDLVVIA